MTSEWDRQGVDGLVRDILRDVRQVDESHHFGRPFMTAYQLAIKLRQRHREAADALHPAVGGRGIGVHTIQRNEISVLRVFCTRNTISNTASKAAAMSAAQALPLGCEAPERAGRPGAAQKQTALAVVPGRLVLRCQLLGTEVRLQPEARRWA